MKHTHYVKRNNEQDDPKATHAHHRNRSCPIFSAGCYPVYNVSAGGGVVMQKTMTRGTAYIILPDDTIKTSCEFNGDMYGSSKDSKELQRDGHYASMVAHLKRANDTKSFEQEIKEFDKIEHSNYQAENNGYFQFYLWKLTQETDKDGTINLNRNYYDRFFSDYLFWKNVSGKPVQFRTQKSKGTPSKIIIVPKGKIATFYFGEHIETI